MIGFYKYQQFIALMASLKTQKQRLCEGITTKAISHYYFELTIISIQLAIAEGFLEKPYNIS